MRLLFLSLAILLASAGCASGPSVVLGGERFSVEIADDRDEQALGLMFRDHMEPDHGMLFVFPREQRRSFWMKNCRIALDIMFFDAEGTLINTHHSVPPCRVDPCPSYPSTRPAQYVLELNAGMARRLGVEPGDRLEMNVDQ